MPITALPTPAPTSTDPANFDPRADALIAALPTFVTEANTLEANVNAKELSATASAATALAGSNFKGNWSALSGALNVPATVYHSNSYWVLLSNLANVATATPGVSASWAMLFPFSASRNKVINGHPIVAQRGTSFAAPASAAYNLDMWQNVNTSAGVFTISQQTDVPSTNIFQASLRVAITTADASIAAGDLAVLRQWIEGYNVRDLIGQTFCISFWVRSTKTGTHCVSLRNSGTDRSYILEYTVNTTNTWEYKTVVVSGGLITAGTWNWTTGQGLSLDFVLAAGTTYQSTAGSWLSSNTYATSAQVNCLDNTSNIFAITGVQLELGGAASPFEQRPVAQEVALCQRYYEKSYEPSATPGSVATAGALYSGSIYTSSARCGMFIPFKVTKRAAATIAYWDQNGNASRATAIAATTGTRSHNVNAVASVNGSSTNGASLEFSCVTTGDYYSVQFTADASL